MRVKENHPSARCSLDISWTECMYGDISPTENWRSESEGILQFFGHLKPCPLFFHVVSQPQSPAGVFYSFMLSYCTNLSPAVVVFENNQAGVTNPLPPFLSPQSFFLSNSFKIPLPNFLLPFKYITHCVTYLWLRWSHGPICFKLNGFRQQNSPSVLVKRSLHATWAEPRAQ